MSRLRSLWYSILDIIFGNAETEKRIRELTPDLLLQKSRRTIIEPSVSALFSYGDPLIKDMIWALKYRRNERVAELFATTLASFITDMRIEEPVLIPLPLSRQREHSRGYNQVTLVLSALTKQLPITVDTHSLVRIRNTVPQTSLSRAERMTNLQGAFKVSDVHAIHGKNILLVDDVSTTGSTLREARKALMEAGAHTVHCIALAH